MYQDKVMMSVLYNSGVEKVYNFKSPEFIESKEELNEVIEQFKNLIAEIYQEGLHGQLNFTTTENKTIIVNIGETSAIEIYKKYEESKLEWE